ncbi:MAG TPA: hypothetical protein VJB90_04755 [Candidatus Nanoarchaeia archaeon]|nr:hypothetical protein [Candidatus Nanoarchaeia archaeon]
MRTRQIFGIFLCCITLLLLLATVPALFPDDSISSYETCKAKNNPTIWYFPKTCKATDGRVFEKQRGCYLGDFECEKGYRCRKGYCVKKT